MYIKQLGFSLALVGLLSSSLSLPADDCKKNKACQIALKTLKVGSHGVELATGVIVAALGLIFHPDPLESWKGYAVGTLTVASLIANGLRGIDHELHVVKYIKKHVRTIKDKMKAQSENTKAVTPPVYNNSPASLLNGLRSLVSRNTVPKSRSPLNFSLARTSPLLEKSK